MRSINLIGTEVTLSGTATTVGNSILVRCVIASGTALVTRSTGTSSPSVIGSCTVISSEPTYLFKDPGDTLTASGSVLASPITFMY